MSDEQIHPHLHHTVSHLDHGAKRIAFLKSPLVSAIEEETVGHNSQERIHCEHNTQNRLWAQDASMRQTPQFRRHAEATSIELFYDLFFVANLTTFTSIHEINGDEELKSFVGYFCLLWFTWCQVSFLDVRFVADSVLERVAKACQFGVMVGLAVVGPNFTPDTQIVASFRTLAIILAVSRFTLAMQYLMAVYHVRTYKHVKTPLALMAFIYIMSALIYGLTWFGFKKSESHGYTYVTWYVVSVMETVFNIVVSSKWKVVSFDGTHLIQRMSLLTLIILGEGIMTVCESIAKLVTTEDTKDAWTSPTIGSVASCILIIYFLYMLYFDWISRHSFSSVRQQIWALLHFPFHLALVMFLEGAAQFIVWRKIVEILIMISTALNNTYKDVNTKADLSMADLETYLNVTVQAIFDFFPPTNQETYDQVDKVLGSIGALTQNTTISTNLTGNRLSNATLKAVDDQINSLFFEIQNSILAIYGIEPPLKNSSVVQTPEDINRQNGNIFDLVYVYFFVSGGLTLILMNTLNIITQRHRIWSDWVRIGFNYLVGCVFFGLAGIHNTDYGQRFALSDWVLVGVALMMMLVLLGSHLHRFSLGGKLCISRSKS